MIEIKSVSGAMLWRGDVESLGGANLGGANLSYADLHGADLHGADLRYADLHGADLHGADLRYADLHGADLRYADLRYANLHGADLRGADLPPFQIAAGELDAWKSINGCLIALRIPREARRTGSLVGRKCRAEWAEVVSITRGGQPVEEVRGGHDPEFVYRVGEVVRPDSYDDNPAVECTHGIHFFLTKEEAEAYN